MSTTDPTSGRLAEALESPDESEAAGRTAYLVIVWLSVFLGLGAHAIEADDGTSVIAAIAVIAGLGVWLHVLHRIQHWTTAASSTRVAVMLAGVYLALVALLIIDPAYLVVLFGAYTLTFGLLADVRVAIALSFIVTLIWVGGWLYHDLPSGAVVTPFLVWGTLVMIAGVMERVAAQSAERRSLLEEIHDTRAQLAEAERQRGVLAERQRMAVEIHDTLAQGFTSIVLLSGATGAQTESISPTQLERSLGLIEQTARDNLVAARRLVEDLKPVELDGDSLAESIRSVGEKHQSATDVVVDVTVTGVERPLGGTVEVTLLRVTQEALNNAMKHANASTIDINLAFGDEAVELHIVDDGDGFSPGDGPTEVAGVRGGRGLGSMTDRVNAAGGTIDIASAPGVGTAIAVTMTTTASTATTEASP